jgi:hypothetical protein
MATVEGLRTHAADLLASTDADVVVLGHSHYPEFTTLETGVYLNPGSWHHQRTFAIITETGPRLYRWTESGPVDATDTDAEPAQSDPAAPSQQARHDPHLI